MRITDFRSAIRFLTIACLLIVVVPVVGGCSRATPEPQVVVYSALDREFAEPILRDFERETGVRVLAKYDVESTKTVGLVTALIQESNRPRCDVFWNNEVLHTLRLDGLDLLASYASREREAFPAAYRSRDDRWYGFAARARVLLVNTDRVPVEDRPDSVEDLVDPRWKGQVGIAKPLFGTTATHAAVLFAAWGDERAKTFFQTLRENARVLSGNKQVALDVASGRLAFGLTDTDDAVIEIERGAPVALVFPDQKGDGTLLIPNSVAILRGAPHPDSAQRLVDYLLAASIEARLAEGPSAQFPLREPSPARVRLAVPDQVRWFPVDFPAAAEKWPSAQQFLRDLFAS